MLGLLEPAWLSGLASLLVPLALHLWSRRGGRPVRVGSIRLLLGSRPATRRSWSIQDLPLLLLRMATLAALVLALAGPYWEPETSPGRWALVAADVAQRNIVIDSLTRAGMDVHPLPGSPDLWTALRDADWAAPRGTRFEVFAPARLRDFRGERPALTAGILWHVRAATQGPALPAGPRGSPRVVAIQADAGRTGEARYVAAALEAAARATGTPAVVTPAADASALASADWIVWLSGRAFPPAVLERVRQGATLLSDAGGAPRMERRSRILFADLSSDAWLARGGAVAEGNSAPLWSDGTGRPLLTMRREGRGLRYRFHSRFDPAWTDLVLRASFPEAMARLWVGVDSASARSRDERPISVRQLLPARDSASSRQAPRGVLPPGARSLFFPAWLLALALFAAERLVARRPRARAE